MNDNPLFPKPPVSMETFKSQIDALATWIVTAMDGSRSAIAQRDSAGYEVKKTLRQLAGYAEYMTGNDMASFLTSGFKPDPNRRTKTAPVSEAIRKFKFGDRSRELKLKAMAVDGASSYEVRWAERRIDRSPRADEWTVKQFSDTRKFLIITGLTPATFYVFQVRALIGETFTDWSDSATHMCK
jgi:hypothetical protein